MWQMCSYRGNGSDLLRTYDLVLLSGRVTVRVKNPRHETLRSGVVFRVYYINLNAQGDGYVEPAAVEDSESRCVLAPVVGI